MAKITGIKKCGGNKYQIELDGCIKIKIYDNVILKNNLLFKCEIDDFLLEQIKFENEREDSYYRVLNFISRKMRCEKEIIDFLDKLEIDFEEKNSIMKRLKQNQLINDKEYAKAYVQDKIFLSSDGPNKIKENLLNNHIDIRVIELAFSEIEEETILKKLEKIIFKKIKSNSTRSNYALKQKIIFEMKKLGYEEYMIIQILDTIKLEENNALVNKEYYKLYRKLSNKYQGDNLTYQIYYKLRQKGFTDNEIKSVMQ